jgi:hypothetical protein
LPPALALGTRHSYLIIPLFSAALILEALGNTSMKNANHRIIGGHPMWAARISLVF